MNSLDLQFHQKLRKKVAETAESEIGHLRSGALSYETYKDKCGYLRALDDVLEWAASIETAINQGK